MHKLVTYFSLDTYISNKGIFINTPRGKCDCGIDFKAVTVQKLPTPGLSSHGCNRFLLIKRISEVTDVKIYISATLYRSEKLSGRILQQLVPTGPDNLANCWKSPRNRPLEFHKISTGCHMQDHLITVHVPTIRNARALTTYMPYTAFEELTR